MGEQIEQPEAGPSNGPHRMRISSGGNVQGYVKFALSFLQNNPHRSLVLHTIPPDPPANAKTAGSSSSSGLHQATLTAPRLISVVELIKRDYLVGVTPNSNHRARGLWQYTESGLLPASQPQEDPADELTRVLSGKTKPKMVHRPYLQITLSRRPLGLEEQTNVTCQHVIQKRKKKKNGKNKEENGELVGIATANGMDVEEEEEAVEEVEERPSTRTPTSKPPSRRATPHLAVQAGSKAAKRKSTSSQDEVAGKRKKNKKE